jgi:acetate kinase
MAAPSGAVRILVVPTNEELRIAQETREVIEGAGSPAGATPR